MATTDYVPEDRVFASLTNYKTPPELATVSSDHLRNLRKSHDIHVTGKFVAAPVSSFEQCNLPERLLSNILSAGFTCPTAIQRQSIPAGLLGRDQFLCSAPGSGKTGAYLIPLLVHTAALARFYSEAGGNYGEAAQEEEKGEKKDFARPFAIVLAPTRELCMQIESTAKTFVRGLQNMKSALLVGGVPLPNQLHRLKQGVQFVVATPGRLLEVLKQEAMSTAHVQTVVIDEADVMFSMGFADQVTDILNVLPSAKQLTFVSATVTGARVEKGNTLSKSVCALSTSLLKEPICVTVGLGLTRNTEPEVKKTHTPAVSRSTVVKSNERNAEAASASSTPSLAVPPTSEKTSNPMINANTIDALNVRHTIMWVEEASKRRTLLSLINDIKYYRHPLLIFVESRIGAELLATTIQKKTGVRTASIHSDKTQKERTAVLDGFRTGHFPILVTTAVLARGIHIDNVKLVMNFDMPNTLDAYVHQAGRAGRSNATAMRTATTRAWAISFINAEQKHIFKPLIQLFSNKPLSVVTPLPPQLMKHASLRKF